MGAFLQDRVRRHFRLGPEVDQHLVAGQSELLLNKLIQISRTLFDNISGALLDGSRIEKDDIIRYALERVGESDISKCIMIGDRSYDVLGAKVFNMDSIGVTWGYGDRDELEAAGATYIVDKAEEIKEII